MATNFVYKPKPGEPIEKSIKAFSRLWWKTGTKHDFDRHFRFTSASEHRARHKQHIRRQKKQKKP